MNPRFDVKVALFVFAGWIFSLCLHEFSHAAVAYRGGDKSVKEKGYLTFNPLRYTHPGLSLVIPLLIMAFGGVGLPGGAVYIDTRRLRSRHWDCAVSLAGPLSNVVLLLLLVLPYQFGFMTDGAADDVPRFWFAYAFLCYLQIWAIFLNLLPVPPLDGFRAIAAYMKPRRREWFNRNAGLFMIALVVVLIRVDAVSDPFYLAIREVSVFLGIPLDFVGEAFPLVRPFRF